MVIGKVTLKIRQESIIRLHPIRPKSILTRTAVLLIEVEQVADRTPTYLGHLKSVCDCLIVCVDNSYGS